MSLRRLRGRLDQLQGKSNQTLNQAQELIALGEALVDDLADGLGITVNVDAHAAKTLVDLLMGNPGKLPLSVQIDPSVDTLPGSVCCFVGGSYDGKRFTVPEGSVTLTLEGGHEYTWDGKVFRYKDV